MADALDLGSSSRKGVGVQVPPLAVFAVLQKQYFAQKARKI